MADNFEMTKRRYKQQEQDRLTAVRGDIAEWLNTLLDDSDLDADNLMEVHLAELTHTHMDLN